MTLRKIKYNPPMSSIIAEISPREPPMLPMNISDRLYCAVTSANSPPFIIASGVAAVTTSAPPKSGALREAGSIEEVIWLV